MVRSRFGRLEPVDQVFSWSRRTFDTLKSLTPDATSRYSRTPTCPSGRAHHASPGKTTGAHRLDGSAKKMGECAHRSHSP